ncbi:hypothetical protein [Mycobacterium sp.]|uniref:hypothetical protein n=1 Tax=Mycobacterium sp. TaxID=1785 RepID=UPI003C714E71
MDKDETQRLRDQLAVLPHYHVVAQYHDYEVVYSDGFTWPGAQGYAADLITPVLGAALEPGLEVVWIVEGNPKWCPLAHGDCAADDEQTAAEFLERAIQQQQPYWSGPLS